MNRLAPASIAALLCLAACSAPAPVSRDRNPFYLSSPGLEADPNDAREPPSPAPQARDRIGGDGAGGYPLQESPYGTQTMPGSSPYTGSMPLGGGSLGGGSLGGGL